MQKKVKINKTNPLLTERGIDIGDILDVINEGPSDQRKHPTEAGKYLHTYLVRGVIGTPIVVYSDEVEVIL